MYTGFYLGTSEKVFNMPLFQDSYDNDQRASENTNLEAAEHIYSEQLQMSALNIFLVLVSSRS